MDAITFPLWVIAIKDTYEERGLPNALQLLEQDGKPFKLLPLFTSEGYASDYIEDSDYDDCIPVLVESASSFYEWLPGLSQRQVVRVKFNLSHDPDQPEFECDIGQFFAELAKSRNP